MSNVRPKEREHKVSTELRHENFVAKQLSSRNWCAFSITGHQVTVRAGCPRFAGQRITCTLQRKSKSLSFAFGAACEERHSESSLRSDAVSHARESHTFGSPRAAAITYPLFVRPRPQQYSSSPREWRRKDRGGVNQGLTLSSRGCPKGYAFCAPLMSNVRRRDRIKQEEVPCWKVFHLLETQHC